SLIVIFLAAVTIPYVSWRKRDKIHKKFAPILFEINDIPPSVPYGGINLTLAYCETIRHFMQENPLKNIDVISCANYEDFRDNQAYQSIRNDFIEKAQNIEKAYKKQERNANTTMFAIILISVILLAVFQNIVDKKYGDGNGTENFIYLR
ncbi:MAG: hypothetical protein FWG22_06190, partial [Prolixibacteraceae bacterium]|nr:hypothetical protein [Prolixibacteraceae bacterium]